MAERNSSSASGVFGHPPGFPAGEHVTVPVRTRVAVGVTRVTRPEFEALLREHETGRKENAWLIAQLAARYQLGEDPREILALEESFRSITPEAVREAARAYLDTDDYVRVTLYPENPADTVRKTGT